MEVGISEKDQEVGGLEVNPRLVWVGEGCAAALLLALGDVRLQLRVHLGIAPIKKRRITQGKGLGSGGQAAGGGKARALALVLLTDSLRRPPGQGTYYAG